MEGVFRGESREERGFGFLIKVKIKNKYLCSLFFIFNFETD